MFRPRPRAIAAAVIAASLIAAGCSDDDSDDGGTTSPQQNTTTVAAAATPAASPTTSPSPTDTTATDTAATDTTAGETDSTVAESEADREGTLTLSQISTPSQWDPIQAPSQAVAYPFLSPIYDRLILLGDDLELEPMLATSWELSDDKRTLTFELREDVTFHDGTPFDAEAAKANLDRVVAADGTLVGTLMGIVGSVDVLDEYTVALNLTDDGTNLPLTIATTVQTGMVSPAALADPAKLAVTPAGSGPYNLLEQRQDRAVYQRVDGYWNDEIDANAPERLEIVSISDQVARINALVTGQIDGAVLLLPSQADWDGIPDSFQKFVSAPTNKANIILVNSTQPPLDDANVRRALSMAIDRAGISSLSAEGACVPQIQVSGPGSVGYVEELDDPSMWEADLDEARRLLDEAGVSDLSLSLLVNDNSYRRDVATIIQAQLAQVGVAVELKVVPSAEHLSTWRQGGDDLWIGSVTASPDLYNVMNPWFVGGNTLGEAPAELVELVDQARVLELGSDERDEAFQEVNRFLAEQPRNIVICGEGEFKAASADVIGLERAGYGLLQTVWDPTFMAVK